MRETRQSIVGNLDIQQRRDKVTRLLARRRTG